MGIKTALAGITTTSGDRDQGYTVGANFLANFDLAQRKCEELTILLQWIQAEMTAAGDSGNATTVGTQVTALA